MHLRLDVGRLWYFGIRHTSHPNFPNSSTSSVIGARWSSPQNLPVHHVIDMDLQNKLWSLTRSQVLWAHNLWELLCAGFRHSAGLHARVILDDATCRLSELGDVRDVLCVVVVWWDRKVKKRKCSWRKARERTTMDETCDTPNDKTLFGAQRCLQIMLGLEPNTSNFRCALWSKLYCTDVSCEWVSCQHFPYFAISVFREVRKKGYACPTPLWTGSWELLAGALLDAEASLSTELIVNVNVNQFKSNFASYKIVLKNLTDLLFS